MKLFIFCIVHLLYNLTKKKPGIIISYLTNKIAAKMRDHKKLKIKEISHNFNYNRTFLSKYVLYDSERDLY